MGTEYGNYYDPYGNGFMKSRGDASGKSPNVPNKMIPKQESADKGASYGEYYAEEFMKSEGDASGKSPNVPNKIIPKKEPLDNGTSYGEYYGEEFMKSEGDASGQSPNVQDKQPMPNKEPIDNGTNYGDYYRPFDQDFMKGSGDGSGKSPNVRNKQVEKNPIYGEAGQGDEYGKYYLGDFKTLGKLSNTDKSDHSGKSPNTKDREVPTEEWENESSEYGNYYLGEFKRLGELNNNKDKDTFEGISPNPGDKIRGVPKGKEFDPKKSRENPGDGGGSDYGEYYLGEFKRLGELPNNAEQDNFGGKTPNVGDKVGRTPKGKGFSYAEAMKKASTTADNINPDSINIAEQVSPNLPLQRNANHFELKNGFYNVSESNARLRNGGVMDSVERLLYKNSATNMVTSTFFIVTLMLERIPSPFTLGFSKVSGIGMSCNSRVVYEGGNDTPFIFTSSDNKASLSLERGVKILDDTAGFPLSLILKPGTRLMFIDIAILNKRRSEHPVKLFNSYGDVVITKVGFSGLDAKSSSLFIRNMSVECSGIIELL